jgi:hypothetical protein
MPKLPLTQFMGRPTVKWPRQLATCGYAEKQSISGVNSLERLTSKGLYLLFEIEEKV